MAAGEEIPQWFGAAIGEVLQVLVTLRLPGAPALDDIDDIADVWTRVLWSSTRWDETADRRRISAALLTLSREVDRWPAPKHVLDRLPPRYVYAKLDAPKLTEHQIRRNHRFLRRLLKVMAARQKKKLADAANKAAEVESPPSDERPDAQQAIPGNS